MYRTPAPASVHGGLLAAGLAFAVGETKYGRATGATIYAPLLPESRKPGPPVKFLGQATLPVANRCRMAPGMGVFFAVMYAGAQAAESPMPAFRLPDGHRPGRGNKSGRDTCLSGQQRYSLCG